MALPSPAPDRQLRHRRQIDVQVFSRGNGLWEVDARLSDVKTRDIRLGGAKRTAGSPIHEMLLRLVVDEKFNILEAGSESLWMPYPGHCDDHGDAYAGLAGLNLLKNFRHSVNERLGGVRGCTHLTELCRVLPTAVVQAFANEVIDPASQGPDGGPPFQIDQCHALRAEGSVVKLHYPRWHRRSTTAVTPEPSS